MKYLIICLLGLLSVNAQAAKDCQCRFQTGGSWTNEGIIVKNWGVISQETVGIGANSAENKCAIKCAQKGFQFNAPNATLQGWACAAGVPHNQAVYACSKAGSIPAGKTDHTMGKVQRTAAVYNCPQGGSLNYQSMSVVPRCVETVPSILNCPNGYWLEAQISKCVKQACPPNSMPGSPNWAAIGAGSMGGINGEYKTDDQDGSRFFINAARSCPAGFQLNGVNCVKSYDANLVTPATCTFVAP